VRYVEGRPLPTIVPLTRIPTLNVHLWVEARIGNKWLTLDPMPDSGVRYSKTTSILWFSKPVSLSDRMAVTLGSFSFATFLSTALIAKGVDI